jgi:mRNA interferase RelE/StbE
VASYSVQIKPSAAKELEELPAKDRLRVVARINSLADDPRPVGSTKLSTREIYRLRQGDYRILYIIEDQVLRVLVIAVAHRREAYRR